MKSLDLIGPVGLVIRRGTVYQYYKDGEDLLVQEKMKKRIRVFVDSEKKEDVLKKIKEFGISSEINVIDDVKYAGYNMRNVSLLSIPLENKVEEFKLKFKSIPGVVGIEDSISNFSEQEYFFSKFEESGDFSREFGYFLNTQLSLNKEGENFLVSNISQKKPQTKEEIEKQLEILRKKLNLSTVDYETSDNKIVMATVKRTDGFSRTLIVNKNLKLLEEFEKILDKHDIQIEIVKDEESLIKKVYEYRKEADVEIVHGASILEKQKDRSKFPSTKGRPSDKFDVKIYFRPVPSIQVVTSEGIIPSTDSLYTCKHEKHPTIRSLEDLLDFLLSDSKTLRKTDYKKFDVYSKLKSAEDVKKYKEEIEETVIHNVQDAVAHLKLGEFLLFDQGLLALPMLYCIDLENVFSKTMEDIGEAIFTSELIKNKIFPKIVKKHPVWRKDKEKVSKKYDRILVKDYGKRIEGRWIYPYYAFIPQIILENKQDFDTYFMVFEKILKRKGDLRVFGVEEKTGKHIIFDPHSFAINCLSAYMLFGRENFKFKEYSKKLFKLFSEMYKKIVGMGESNEFVYLSPFKSRAFISGSPEKTKNFIEELRKNFPYLLTDYNKHNDVFIPLNDKQALATESGKIVKIGWRGASKSDPRVVKEAVNNIVNKFVNYGLNEAKSEFNEQINKIEKIEYPQEFYKVSGKLNKKSSEYKREDFKLKILKKAQEEYKRNFGREPSGFMEFFVTMGESHEDFEIDFSQQPKGKINGMFYVEYLKERIKPLLPLFEIEEPYKNGKITSYMRQ